jgi:hypothetical protein
MNGFQSILDRTVTTTYNDSLRRDLSKVGSQTRTLNDRLAEELPKAEARRQQETAQTQQQMEALRGKLAAQKKQAAEPKSAAAAPKVADEPALGLELRAELLARVGTPKVGGTTPVPPLKASKDADILEYLTRKGWLNG